MSNTFNKFDQFSDDLMGGVHNLGSDALTLMLSDTLPDRTNTVIANITEIAAGHGYTAGGYILGGVTLTDVTGTTTMTASTVPVSAVGGSIGPFKYFVLYNNTAANGPLICWWTSPNEITVADTTTYVFNFDSSGNVFNLQ